MDLFILCYTSQSINVIFHRPTLFQGIGYARRVKSNVWREKIETRVGPGDRTMGKKNLDIFID